MLLEGNLDPSTAQPARDGLEVPASNDFFEQLTCPENSFLEALAVLALPVF